MGKRALVTGATGFVGANLARRLLADGHEVHLLVRPGHDRWRLTEVADAVLWHQAGLEDPAGLRAAVERARPQWVFHLAVHGAYPDQTDLRRMVETNVVGTINLVEACLAAGFESFVHAGSSSEYGFKAEPPDETTWLEPNSDYAWAKAAATLYCRQVAQRRRLPLTTLRLYSVYGPFEAPRRLIPTLILRGLAGALPPLVDPEVARDFVYVDDAVEAFLLAARATDRIGAVYNVGTGRQTTLREVVALARAELGVAAEPSWGTMPNRAWDTRAWTADPGLIERELGWRPRHAFADGFRRFVSWFREAPARRALYEERLRGDA